MVGKFKSALIIATGMEIASHALCMGKSKSIKKRPRPIVPSEARQSQRDAKGRVAKTTRQTLPSLE